MKYSFTSQVILKKQQPIYQELTKDILLEIKKPDNIKVIVNP